MAPAVNNGPPRGFLLSTKPIVLWIHDPSAVYNHDAVVNPEMFPNFRDGQLLRILCPRITQQPQQQSQNSNKSDQQDNKKQLDHNTPQQNSQQTQQQTQQNQQLNQTNQQQTQSEQSNSLPQLSQSSDKQEHHEQLDFVIVKGHAADKENLAKQQQLQVCLGEGI